MKVIIGHSVIQERLEAYAQTESFPQALLLEGLQGIGKTSLALQYIARALSSADQSCEEVYAQILSGMHPDVLIIRPPEHKKMCDVTQMQEIVEFTQKTPLMGLCQYILLDSLDVVHYTARDAILKCLEQARHARFFLIAHSHKVVTTTIRSRSQTLHFSALDYVDFQRILADEEWQREKGKEYYIFSGGSPGFAKMLAEDSCYEPIESFLLFLYDACHNMPGVEAKVMRMAGMKQIMPYDLLLRLLENCAAHVSVHPTETILKKTWSFLPYALCRMRSL
ncbi:MAG: hypothetical protein OXC30_06875, partial [Alphaproteobacteria bacterium]|nr:hypothetical protein [Alphaproteobacteria bacterium]